MTRVLAILSAILGVALVATLLHFRQVRREFSFRVDSLEVAADSTRRVGQTWMRRALQAEIRETQLEDSLKLWPKVTTIVKVRLDTLWLAAEAPVVDDTLSRRASFHNVREGPVTADVDVSLPPPPKPGRLALRVAVAPIPLTIRAGCGPVSPTTGIRPATILATGPTWATIHLDSLQTHPDVCNHRTALVQIKTPGWFYWVLPPLSLLAGALAF